MTGLDLTDFQRRALFALPADGTPMGKDSLPKQLQLTVGSLSSSQVGLVDFVPIRAPRGDISAYRLSATGIAWRRDVNGVGE